MFRACAPAAICWECPGNLRRSFLGWSVVRRLAVAALRNGTLGPGPAGLGDAPDARRSDRPSEQWKPIRFGDQVSATEPTQPAPDLEIVGQAHCRLASTAGARNFHPIPIRVWFCVVAVAL